MAAEIPSPPSGEVEISVVAPVFNEADCVVEFCERVQATLAGLGRSFEIIPVDDGSSDETPDLLYAASQRFEEIRPLYLARNRGQALALAAGVEASRGDKVVIMDSDLQHLPEDIPKLLAEMDRGFDLVSGSRVNRQESLWRRRLPSKVANYLIRSTTGCQVRDMGGFQSVRGSIIRSMQIRPGQHRFLPALVHIMGGAVSEVPVESPVRHTGKSNYGLERVLEVAMDLLLLWFVSAARSRPLYFLGRYCALAVVLAGLLFGYVLVDKIFFDIPMGTRPPLIISGVMAILALIIFLGAITLELLSEVLNRVAGHRGYMLKQPPPH